MYLINNPLKFIGYVQKSSSILRLLKYTKLGTEQAFIVRYRYHSGNLKYTAADGPPGNFERDYFDAIMKDSLKYPACNFSIDHEVHNKKTTNGLVLMLRELAREEGRQVSEVNDLPAIENFDAHMFTPADFLEIFYLLSIPEVISRVTYDRADLCRFLANKYVLIRPTVGHDPGMLLSILHLLKKANLNKSSITFYVVQSLQKRYKMLTSPQIIELYYFLNSHRISFSRKEFKYHFEEILIKKLCDFTCDEVAVIAYYFFRSQQFPGLPLISAICKRIEYEIPNWNDVHATVFSKFLRYCGKANHAEGIGRILDKCLPLVEKFTLTTLIHVSCSGIGRSTECTELLKRVLDRTKLEISTVRLKDLERLLLACLYSNIHLSQESEIIKLIVENLETREDEINEFPRSFWSLLQYLIMYGVYVESRISFALSEETIQSIPSNAKRSMMHELLFIDASTEIERPNYEGNTLPELLRKKISARHSAVINSALDSSSYKCILSMTTMLENIYGKGMCTMERLMPHFATYHPILCFNQDKKAQHIEGRLHKSLGTIVKAPDDGNHWLCFILVRQHGYLSDHITPNLVTATKIRQFKAVGYTPIMVSHREWMQKTESMKDTYLREVVECALLNGSK